MEDIITRYRERLELNRELRELIEDYGPEGRTEIIDLFERGADPNDRPRFSNSFICSIIEFWPVEDWATGIELLTHYGANVNLPDAERRTALSFLINDDKYSEICSLLLSKGAIPINFSKQLTKSPELYCRYGRSNPERVSDDYFTYMVATGHEGYVIDGPEKGSNMKAIEDKFNKLTRASRSGEISPQSAARLFNRFAFGTPKWTNNRFGTSRHFFNDGTMLLIGGEQGDWYDEDFYIYNDVIKISPKGEVEVLLYPKDIFPPTDFHTSTRIGDKIYIIGGVGYSQDEDASQTKIHILDLNTFSIRKVRSTGNGPGQISEHLALPDEKEGCIYILNVEGKDLADVELNPNENVHKFNVRHHRWQMI